MFWVVFGLIVCWGLLNELIGFIYDSNARSGMTGPKWQAFVFVPWYIYLHHHNKWPKI